MDENATSTIPLKSDNHSTSTLEITDNVVASNNVIESNLFNGYTWQGWLTMTICFLGAAANIFHVSYCIISILIMITSLFKCDSRQMLDIDTLLIILFRP